MKQIAKIAIIAGIAKIENLSPVSFSITQLPDFGNFQLLRR
ncbi:MAG TPA: hypothetical protein VKE93_11335 [Candidatus Angelobacter sp.]|nr:hypothetical protein [Candidatus Angelobacter sp.]